ncbi:MAG: DoxX family protein [Chitinophagaceae bacterium]
MKKLFSIKYSDNGITFAALIMRLTFGGLLITHGYSKLMNFAKYSSTFSDPFHIGHSTSLALTIFAEFFCAVFLVLGLFTRLACIPPIVAMAVATFHAHQGLVFTEGEKAALFLGGLIALLFVGPGKLSLDKLIGK